MFPDRAKLFVSLFEDPLLGEYYVDWGAGIVAYG